MANGTSAIGAVGTEAKGTSETLAYFGAPTKKESKGQEASAFTAINSVFTFGQQQSQNA